MIDGSRVFGYFIKYSTENVECNKEYILLTDYVFERDIYYDEYGKNNKGKLIEMVKQLREGDTVYFCSLEPLLDDVTAIKILLGMFDESRIKVCVLDLPTSIADLNEYYDGDKPLYKLINSLIIDLLNVKIRNAIAANRRRQDIGFMEARNKGIKLGRKPKEIPPTFEDDIKKWRQGLCSAKSLYQRYGWSSPCFYKHIRIYEKKQTV